MIGIALFNMLRRLGQLDLVITLSYIALLGTVGTLTLLEGARSLRAARRGKGARMLRQGGQHPRWMRGPLMMRFPRSRLYCSAVPISGWRRPSASPVRCSHRSGFILVPALLFLFRVPTTVVIGTTQLQIVFTMAAATIIHALTNGSVDILLALLLIIGGAVGARGRHAAGFEAQGRGLPPHARIAAPVGGDPVRSGARRASGRAVLASGAREPMMRALAFVLLVLLAGPARAETLVLSLATHQIAISSSFFRRATRDLRRGRARRAHHRES